MEMFKIGQKCIVKPVTFNAGTEVNPKEATGTITYIHPRLRYVVVGIQTEGGQIRECFAPGKVMPLTQPRK